MLKEAEDVEHLELRRHLLHVLGTGGTMEMAERAAWEVDRLVNEGRSTAVLERLGGLHEVCALIDRPKNVVCNWQARPGKINFPQPVLELAATKVWDLDQVRTWAVGNPDLAGPGFDPFG